MLGCTESFIIFSRWQICAPCRTGGSGAWYHGLREIRTLRTDLPTRQLCVRSERCRQQLGQGPLHRGRWARRLCARCGPQGGRGLWLSAGLPADPLSGWWHRLRYGHPAHQQDPWGVPRQDHEHILRRTIPQGKMNDWSLVRFKESFNKKSSVLSANTWWKCSPANSYAIKELDQRWFS